ncbi:unnamed protein product [Rotaria sordida]|uniref:Endoplasmic reticulum chaperone BIP n=1 Tax=Rotaria sordida TaxID=392033 RepID=A0A819M442_9BILA|nr:unnamed protein product [Rotaria sordida]CAF1430151.1 unnamed protein product [Rotaria sordida]CAF1605047.1 unnamed protein product [Rotaria sordida]CAF3973402.1 unnamed protein product [Rotaria sordida]
MVNIYLCSDAQQMKKDLGTVIGIDLGTTYSCVGIFKNCHVEIIENDQGNRITPSCVAFTPDGQRLIGDAAKNLLTSNPQNTLFQIKRIIGRKFNDSSVQTDIKHFPFTVIERYGKPIIKVDTRYGEKLFTPEEISAMILGKMCDIAEGFLGTKVKNAVVTVPAYFNDAQRQATKDAGTIAGLNVIRIINEPTAAAIAFGLDKMKQWDGAKNILVFDLGGGTFDVSLLVFDNGVFEVLATNGDTHLGGEDFDQRIIEYFIKLFKTKKGKDMTKNIHAVEKLRREVEKAKRILSSEHHTRVEIESFIPNEDFSEILTRAKFEELNIDLFRSTMIPVENVLKDAKLKKSDIAEVLLVGGSTRIPKIRQILKEFFNGKEPSRGINPDEAVAHGAAIQGAILAGDKCVIDNEIVIIDVNPLTMGIEVKDGAMSSIIPRNSHIPITKTQPFTTVSDNQHTVGIRIFEGERPMAKHNHFLGEFDLTGIPLAPRGIPQIDVTFDIDVDGILNVTAKETTGGNKKSIVINAKTNRLSSEQIDRMIKVAELFTDEDKLVKQRIDAKNELESYTYSLRNQLNDPKTLFEELSSREKSTITNAIENQIKWIDNNPNGKTDDFKKQKKQLERIVLQIMSKIHGYNSNNTRSQSSQYYGEL